MFVYVYLNAETQKRKDFILREQRAQESWRWLRVLMPSLKNYFSAPLRLCVRLN